MYIFFIRYLKRSFSQPRANEILFFTVCSDIASSEAISLMDMDSFLLSENADFIVVGIFSISVSINTANSFARSSSSDVDNFILSSFK
ncbi:hypothetical protein D3C72_1871450 [compost metagenome]